MISRSVLCLLFCAGATCLANTSSDLALRAVTESADSARATIRVHADQRARWPVPGFITGKFAEHLGWNIYNGMDAQVLRNPTFAEYPFSTGQTTPDGVTRFQVEDAQIHAELRRQATRFGWPREALDSLVRAHADALAGFWTRVGSVDAVQVSPDTGPHGGRAQRVQVQGAGQGIAQWTWLPLHRQRQFEFEIMVRSPSIRSWTVSIEGWTENVASARVSAGEGVEGRSGSSTPQGNWQELRGKLIVPDSVPADQACRFAITADEAGQFVVCHAFLRPADHVGGADPDIIALLRESHLPLLRWPGGNFVSTYHWEDGVGPVEARPTKPNEAWGAIEPNTFGTAEFIAFCRAVKCEPMICVNAGSGSPEEAARWIEYCNGPVTSPMGRLRAAHGHPESFQVRHWEVGNELWGHWQMRWTTAQGYVDRYQTFSAAMLAADPGIKLYSCGAPVFWGKGWNETLMAGVGPSLGTITDHPLIGGSVPASTDPLDVYRDFMAVPEVLQEKWAGLRSDLRRAGILEPHLAITELQLFAHLASGTNAPVRLTRENLPSQASITEAIYDILIYHAAIRLGGFVEMVTHSAIVNHGGGLRKERERVWANPCHYAQAAFASMAGATPVATEISTATERAPLVLPDLRNVTEAVAYGAVDALGAVARDGTLLLSLVHRGTAGPVRVSVSIDAFNAAGSADLRVLSAATPWQANSLEQPGLVKPVDSLVTFQNGTAEIELAPYTVGLMRIHPVQPGH